MWLKLKAFSGLIKGILLFIITLGIYRAGKKSERLDQAEADNLAQREVNKEITKGNGEYQEKVDEARNNDTGSGRFT